MIFGSIVLRTKSTTGAGATRSTSSDSLGPRDASVHATAQVIGSDIVVFQKGAAANQGDFDASCGTPLLLALHYEHYEPIQRKHVAVHHVGIEPPGDDQSGDNGRRHNRGFNRQIEVASINATSFGKQWCECGYGVVAVHEVLVPKIEQRRYALALLTIQYKVLWGHPTRALRKEGWSSGPTRYGGPPPEEAR